MRDDSCGQERDIVKREDPEWAEVSKNWLEVNQKMKVLEKEEKALREVLIQMAGVQNVTGGGVRLTRSFRKGSIQYGEIPELKNIDLEKYRKEPMEIWTLVSSEKKKIVKVE